MGKEVHEGEQDREWLLHTKESVKGPFSMILNDWLEHGRITANPLVGDDMLAGVIAVRGASPEEETEVKS